jgi:hypothetical protein
MDHHFVVALQVVLRVLKINTYGRRANGIYVPRYQNVGNDKRDYLRGFGYQGGASRGSWHEEVAELEFGGDFKDKLSFPADTWYGTRWFW